MKILVTGGTGFIGRKVCRALVASGHQVIVFSRNPGKVAKLIGHSCRGIGDIAPETFKESVDAIFNLAGEPIADSRWTDARKAKLRDSRIATTQKIVELCAALNPPPKVLISASAVGYYGDQGDNKVIESTPPHEEFTHLLCQDWEQQAMEARELGVRVAVARIGLVVGKGGFLKKMLTPFKLGVGGKLGNGKQWMPWIHVQDLVNILLYLMEHDTCEGVYNAVSPSPVTNEEFTRTLGEIVGRPTVFTVPKIVLESTLGEMARLLLTGQRAFPDRLMEQEAFVFNYDKLEDALRDVV